ncbi:MAG: ATP-binding cassette domain-containing protein [Sphaerochaetaceae bacterium]
MLKVENLFFAYRDYLKKDSFKPVLNNLNLTLKKGKKLLILGAPDSGKSTLARILCALIPRHMDGKIDGTIKIGELDIGKVSPWDLTNLTTLVTQNPQEQLLMSTCSEEVAFPLESLGISHQIIEQKVEEALNRWSLKNFALVNPQELSQGEQRRLLLSVTDAINSPFWIMDETFDDLDVNYKEVLAKRLKEEKRTILLFASRYLKEYKDIFDNYALLKEGRLSFGEKNEILTEYEKESKTLFNPINSSNTERKKQVLQCSDAQIIHPRRSLISSNPFTLNVKNFYLESGEVVALVGPNGSGKSTFSRALCALDPFVKGTITIDKEEQTTKELQKQVGYLFQNPDFGIFLPTVKEELGWSLRKDKALSQSEKEEIVAKTAKLFHLKTEDNPSMMSYGSRKYLQAAVYYIIDRPFIIIDELDSGVTYNAACEIINLFQARGAAVLIITHDSDFAKEVSRRQYKIIDSNIVETEVGF